MKIILLVAFCITFQFAFSQKKIKQISLPEPSGDPTCVYKPTFSAAQRFRLYPFNTADTIKLVSFKYHTQNLPIKQDTLISDSLLEVPVLSRQDIVELTDLLYNHFNKSPTNYGTLALCFFPRNALLFFDKKGKMIASVLICFHCEGYVASSSKVNMGDNCSEKTEKLRNFFSRNGISYGTDKTIDSYPGEAIDGEVIVQPPKSN